ncbi:hypothetical protein C7S18_21765 [Ahniella affigens]|uniref:DUF2066 domain-containing protein n=1 Tax=Ahniella affigens TaxID=2021234 RepID=A0A2P1PXS6_9GAMM|nr:DUF2066 domain-containing protein [Ahniella affigens]AVP99640.1 hypothetical protein C7S18_21765 [Ahniella affigens]
MLRRLISPLLALLMLSLPLRAEVVAIYEADAPVLSEDARDRDQGIRSAFRRMLVKASGDVSIASAAEVEPLLSQLEQWTVSSEPRQQVVTNALGQPEVRNVLRVRFDPEAVRRVLTNLGRPIWPENRPAMMVWLVVDDGTRKQIASASQVQALGALTGRAEERGLIVQLPNMDSVDQGRVDPVTLWDAPLKTVVGASGRYGIQTSLLVRLRRTGEQWSAQYALIQGSQYEEWSAVDASSGPLLSYGMDGAADRLARRYAFDSSEPAMGLTSLWLTEVRSGADYARALGYLRKLEVIRDLQVLGADGDRAWLAMTVQAGPKRFKQLLKFDQQLSLLELPVEAGKPALYALELQH